MQDQTIDLRFRIPSETWITHMTTDVRYAPACNDVCRQSAGRRVHIQKWACSASPSPLIPRWIRHPTSHRTASPGARVAKTYEYETCISFGGSRSPDGRPPVTRPVGVMRISNPQPPRPCVRLQASGLRLQLKQIVRLRASTELCNERRAKPRMIKLTVKEGQGTLPLPLRFCGRNHHLPSFVCM